MLQQILSQALRKEHREAGLFLDEEDDHFLYLKCRACKGKRVAAFNSRAATIESILDAADKHNHNKKESVTA